MSGRVFVCHASEDAATARQVVALLEAAGRPCWIAPRDIPVGGDFAASIVEALGSAALLVLVFSGEANLSPHVRRELEAAVGRDIPLVPVRVDTVVPSPSLQYFISSSQWLDTSGVPVSTWGPALVAAVERLLGAPEPETKLPPVVTHTPATLPPLVGTTWGRDALIGEVCARLQGGGLVTLTGLGGVGKSRLAAEVARRVDGLTVADDASRADVGPTPLLATSRRPLGLPGEYVVPVPPLDPDAAARMFREAAARSGRAADLDAAAVADVCRLVGRLPLGVDLAAARLRVVGLDRLVAGLATSLDLVTGLSEALELSLVELAPDQLDLLGRLALFDRPVPLAAVESVTGPAAIDTLAVLVDGSLVLVEDGPLYLLPHPVRLLARRDLENSDRAEAAHAAVAGYLASRVADWQLRLNTSDGPRVSAEFSAAAPDVEAAVEVAVLSGRTDAAYDLLVAAERLWLDVGRTAEPGALCEQLLATLPAEDPRTARLHALLGRFAYQRTEWSAAEEQLRTAWRLGAELGDEIAVLNARIYLSGVLLMLGQVEEGSELAGEVYAETQAAGLYPQTAEGLFMLALSRMMAGDLDGEREAHERRLEVVRAQGDVARTADQLNTLAEIALDEDDPDKALRYTEETLKIAAARFPLQHRDATITLARALAVQGDRVAAGRALADALAASGRLGQSLATAQCLRVAGVLAESGGGPALAVRLFAAAQALSPSPTGTDDPPEVDLAAALVRARAALDEREQEREWTLGMALPLATMLTQLDEAIDLNGS